ncbi:hypothetical protein ACGFYU_26650 [Streptomyces sp. NPDC048337]
MPAPHSSGSRAASLWQTATAIVSDEELMARHRLELAFGFVPSSVA